DKALIKLEEAEGMSTFLRLERVKKWSDFAPFHKEATENVEELIKRVTDAVEKHLGDKDRIAKYIAQLDAPTPEERGFAFIQINRSGKRAVPYLIETLRTKFGKTLFGRAREMLLRLDSDTVPLYLEIFKAVDAKDASSPDLRLWMLDIVHER